MSDEETKLISNPRSFEEKVLEQLDELRSRVAETQETIKSYFDNFDEKLDVINNELLQLKADQRKTERRLRKLEVEDRPQVVLQNKGF
jgi:hypothetical protein